MSTAPPTSPKSVVVGLDQSAGARAALDWAAAEAVLRGAPLLIATAWTGMDREEYEPNIADPVHRAAVTFVEEAAADMRARHSGLDVDTSLMTEDPVGGLIRLAQDADLLVVGRRGLNALQILLLGSVSQQLVAHSPVPVAVVPENSPATAADAPVVVGAARELTEPLDFAFAEARTRGAPVVAVRAWSMSNPYLAAMADAVDQLQAEEGRELESLVEAAKLRHPAVEVSTRVEFASPEAALIEASEGAALVVVGRHRRHSRYGLPIGRVPHKVLHLSDLPVVVVPN
ncbi:hypothetical protein DN069_30345 [Streptacidiphilus pinicola]|uniref:UspA domain-containing protein n=1 Tax=Streptacidiphilus pinicola TaxID=2219663 RepID=A0A2X0JY48_9ACTN|nr:universal stress protein [Streptacidiphilus pinicola]RAG81925.1 hypothetical protein DN069_30345 [Streptacidiphilus pinicola]